MLCPTNFDFYMFHLNFFNNKLAFVFHYKIHNLFSCIFFYSNTILCIATLYLTNTIYFVMSKCTFIKHKYIFFSYNFKVLI